MPDPRPFLHRVRRAEEPGDPASGAVALHLQGVTVRRGPRVVVEGVDLTVAGGEIVALVGPNGAGKSSLLGAIAGELPASGGIELLGRPMAAWTPVEAAMRRAMLPQRSDVAFAFTVRQVVEMGRTPWAGTEASTGDAEVVQGALEDVGVAHLADRPFPALSGGERARVALARVLAQSTPVLLLDEPTAALDIRHQALVLQQARARAERGVAVIAALHDLAAAAAYADRVIVLHRGRCVADDRPDKVLRPELLEAVYDWPIEIIRHPRTGLPIVLPGVTGQVATSSHDLTT